MVPDLNKLNFSVFRPVVPSLFNFSSSSVEMRGKKKIIGHNVHSKYVQGPRFQILKSTYVQVTPVSLNPVLQTASDSFFNPRFFMRPNGEDLPNKVMLAQKRHPPAVFEGQPIRRNLT